MSEDSAEGAEDAQLTSWRAARDRIVRFAGNIVGLERTIERLVRGQVRQAGEIDDLAAAMDDLKVRMERLEAQQEIIIRLLERRRGDD